MRKFCARHPILTFSFLAIIYIILFKIGANIINILLFGHKEYLEITYFIFIIPLAILIYLTDNWLVGDDSAPQD